MPFSGLMTALVTPFSNGKLCEETFRATVRRQIEGGVDGLVPCGTTGEAPTLSRYEQDLLVEWCVEEADGRVPVLAGIGGNNTAVVIENALRVEALGVNGVLATTPYYNKPTQAGLVAHFSAIAESTKIEVCLYDVPGRTITNIDPMTVAELSQLDNITAIKDATGDMANAMEIRRLCGDKINILSGDDFTTLPFLAQGGDGVISVASNVVPSEMKQLVNASKYGELAEAQGLTLKLFPLFSALFCESNPIPVKAAMSMMGLMSGEIRLPLTVISDSARAKLVSAMSELGLSDS